MRGLLATLACTLALGSLTGCSIQPTYPEARLAESLQAVLVAEHLQTTVKALPHTVAIQLSYPGVIAQQGTQIGLGPQFDVAMQKSLTQIHRVLLSTDADIQFYVLLLSDPELPGAYLTMVRYLDDIRRANASMMDTPEIFARTIFELNVVEDEQPIILDQYLPRDIRLEEFLSWQLARRIQYSLTEALQPPGRVDIGRCAGAFENGEFAFTLDLAPVSGDQVDAATLDEAFEASTAVIAKVLSSYQFDHFQAVRLIHPLSGRNLVLPKSSLQLFH